jgi:anti-anti-sigma regulatory factor
VTPLEIQTSELGRHTLVTLWGELDVTNSGRLTGRLMAIFSRISLTADGHNGDADLAEGAGVIVHLAELRWCDTTGLSSFIEAAKAARDLDVGFAVAGAKHRVARILEVTGLEKAAWVHDELADAVRSVHREEPV